MNKKIKITIISIILIALLAVIFFVWEVNKTHYYTPITSEMHISDSSILKSAFLLTESESTIEVPLKENINFVSDVDNQTAKLSTTKIVFGFYECDINRDYNEFNPSITYSSSNENVAVVSEEGILTLKSKGEAVITVKADEVSLDIPILVNKAVLVTELEQNITLLKGESKNIAIFNDYEVPFTDFYSSNESVVTVNQNGVVNAIAKGVAEVYTYIDEEKTQKVSTNITVKQPVESISVKSISIYEGDTAKIEVAYLPSNADYGTNFTYSLADPSIATISGSNLTGIKSNITQLTVTSGNGISAYTSVKVSPRPRAQVTITNISKEEFNAYTGEKYSDNSPYAGQFKISFSEPVIGFRINYVTDDLNKENIQTGAALYNNASVPANTPIYFDIIIAEGDVFSTRGFSYTNLDGTTVYYKIRLSGRDGSILYSEY